MSDNVSAPSTALERVPREEKGRMAPAVSLLCNWGACGDVCIAALLGALGELHWDTPKLKQRDCQDAEICDPDTPLGHDSYCLFDLGCGDGRVLTEVCKRFPGCRCVGVDLNGNLVQAARARAKREGEDVSERCEFRQEDLQKTRDLELADAIFMYLPAAALKFVVTTVLPKANLKAGTAIFTAEEMLPDMPELYTCMRKSRQNNHEARRLYWYTWNGSPATAAGKRDWISP
jgi:SAM-dependent methyltransferase